MPPMRHLTLGDLRLALKDILDTHASDLDRSTTGKVYRPLLVQKRAEIEAQPEATPRGAAYAADLAEVDARHDAYGAAIYHLTLAVLLHPAVDAATKDIALRAQETFVPALGVLSARYADEAAHAHRKRAAFEALRPELEQIAVPGGAKLSGWVEGFLDHGDRIGELLHGRAEAGALAAPSFDGGALKSSTVGLLGRFRQAIRDEIASGLVLPKDYEARLFALVDLLNDSRAEAQKRRVGTKQAGAEPSPEPANGEEKPAAGC